ncbi:membrane protein insertion efficiency factor YidD [Luteimonas sp. A537]
MTPNATTSASASRLAAIDAIGRTLIVSGIHLYRRWLRSRLRRKCLFDTSCSEFVLRAARTDGTLPALKAFAVRFRTCRGDYSIASVHGVPHALSRCGSCLPLHELAPAVREEVELAYSEARDASSANC